MPFIVCEVTSIEPVVGKAKLRKLTVNIGDGSEGVTVVTNAPNVREGTRTVLATVGTEVEVEGEAVQVTKSNVGGVVSEGMICDSVMLGWTGGAAGIAVQVPANFALGSEAPKSKPRLDGGADSAAAAVPELSAKDLKAKQKADRKAELAAKKEARLASKGDKKNDKKGQEQEQAEGEGGGGDDDEHGADDGDVKLTAAAEDLTIS